MGHYKIWIAFVLISFLIVSSLAQQEVMSNEIVGVSEPSVCCETTNSGLNCQNVKKEDCRGDSRQPTTSCESTAFCNPGFCYDSNEGTCMDNVPQVTCNKDGGTWFAEAPPVCNLGCCVLEEQAALVTLVSCKQLSGYFGLETKWNADIIDQDECLLSAGGHIKGACVTPLNDGSGKNECKFVTKEACLGGGDSSDSGDTVPSNNLGLTSDVTTPAGTGGAAGAPASGVQTSPDETTFYEGKLCTAEELQTTCAPSRETTCLDDKEEVYFVDTCGNPANIYDASMISNDDYWANVKTKTQSCGPGQSNENSQTCGNCNYPLGSYCREATSETANPTYGENICASLNCADESGKKRFHGESWCKFDKPGEQDSGKNSVGSKFFRNICLNGEVKVEPCAEFRQEECIESSQGGYSQAGCRVNRWQDCTAQVKKDKCLNSDRRDCKWLEGIEYVLLGVVPVEGDSSKEGAGTVDGSGTLAGLGQKAKQIKEGDADLGACVPENPPGLNFWGGEGSEEGSTEAETICSQANAACPVTYKKGLIGGDWECSENCECLSDSVRQKRVQLCMSMGDCGPNVNIVGAGSSSAGYKIKQTGSDDDDGGLF